MREASEPEHSKLRVPQDGVAALQQTSAYMNCFKAGLKWSGARLLDLNLPPPPLRLCRGYELQQLVAEAVCMIPDMVGLPQTLNPQLATGQPSQAHLLLPSCQHGCLHGHSLHQRR